MENITFTTGSLPLDPDVIAPDGSTVRVLLRVQGGSMAHFTLAPGQTSRAVTHRTVEEIWYFLEGYGELWRKLGAEEAIVPVAAGVCITLPRGTHFQFRTLSAVALTAIGVTLPPWPGEGEAYEVAGPWSPTVENVLKM